MSIFKIFRVMRTLEEIFRLVDEAMKALQDGRLAEDEAKALIVKIYAILKVLR